LSFRRALSHVLDRLGIPNDDDFPELCDVS